MLVARSWLGFAKETTWGTAVAPSKYVPVDEFSAKDEIARILDEGKRGIGVKDFGAFPGLKSATLRYSGAFYPDVPPWFILGILGAVTTTGTSPNFTHNFTFAESPPSFTIHDYNGIDQRQFAGAVVESLELAFAVEEALRWTVSLRSKASSTATPATPTFGTTSPFLAWQATLTVAAQSNARLSGFEMTMRREAIVRHTASGSRDPSKISGQPLEVTGRMTFFMDSLDEYDKFAQMTMPAVSLKLTQNANTEIEILMSKCDFEDATIDRGREEVMIEVPFRAHYNTTDSGPCKITVKNQVASYAS